MIDEATIREALKLVMDPEIGMSVVDLNMIKSVTIDENEIDIKMVLTTPGCPLMSYMLNEVKEKVESISEGKKVNVSCLNEKWTPPWISQSNDGSI
jgi:metal-sulfur cluster biosynthetic enzyme